MAGILPPRKKQSGRKQWTLHGNVCTQRSMDRCEGVGFVADGPRGSLRRLRNQLASDGCPESQVVLAKQLLEEECELEIDQKENARLGVYWLIKASEQGNCEATEMLSNCLVTGRGITEHNFIDVKSCINMTQDEKIARKAAREMFASLSNGEDFITSEQLQKRMIEIQNGWKSGHKSMQADIRNGLENGEIVNEMEATDSDETSWEDMDWSSRTEKNNEKLTEDNLVAAAVNYANGDLPLVNQWLSLTCPDLNCLDSVPYMQRSVRHPLLAVEILYFKLVNLLGSCNFMPFNRGDFQLLLLVVYSMFSVKSVFLFLPMVFYYVSLAIMFFTTFSMLQSSRDFQDFHVWSRLFLTYSGGSLNPEEAEYQFVRKHLRVYGHFFAAFLVNLIIYPLIVEQWLPQSEITVVAFCVMFLTLFTFMVNEKKYPDILLLLSFALNVLAKYPYEIDPVVAQRWRFLDLKIPTLASYIIGNGIEFCLNFRLIFYIFIPVVLVYLAAREKWRGTYKFLIPHCVTLSWLQIVVINSQGATMFGLLRGTLALVGVVLFVPLFGVTMILLPALAFAKWFTNNFVFSFVVFVVVSSVALAISWLLAQTRFTRLITYIQVLSGLIAACVLMNPLVFHSSKSEIYLKRSEEITWETYQSFCHQPAWDTANLASTQIKCAQLENVPVRFNGYVNEIKLKSIKNNYKLYIDKLGLFNQVLYCYFGKPVEDSCENIFNEALRNDCLNFKNASPMKQCSLEHLNAYEFEVSVRMQSGIWGKNAEVILIADHPFTNFTLQLRTNDKIWFSGDLINDPTAGVDGFLGGVKPRVALREIGCLACHNTNLTYFKNNDKDTVDIMKVIEVVSDSFKFVINILFWPIVVVK